MRSITYLILTLMVIGFRDSTRAQEVSIPDPGLNAAIREALQKPFGPLTEPDLLSLTNLNASRRNVRSIAGLEAARNLVSLDLQINRLTNFSLPTQFTNLIGLDLSVNPLTNLSLREQGVGVFANPLTVQLIRIRQPIGAFQFAITGPPGVYAVLASTDLAVWNDVGFTTNSLGSIVFTDVTAHLSPQKFYRARFIQ